ncbi:hypothetical protein ISE1_1186 [plant metagenome]|uniref:Uncharacterized protein n=1 Tax=plant metagenome TaxID=1297885 RepID=A0A484VBZ6_9ZZZZ
MSASIAARPGGACGIIGLDDEDGPGWGRFCTAVSRPGRPCLPVAPGKPAPGLKAGPARNAVVPGPRRASPLSLGLAPGLVRPDPQYLALLSSFLQPCA